MKITRSHSWITNKPERKIQSPNFCLWLSFSCGKMLYPLLLNLWFRQPHTGSYWAHPPRKMNSTSSCITQGQGASRGCSKVCGGSWPSRSFSHTWIFLMKHPLKSRIWVTWIYRSHLETELSLPLANIWKDRGERKTELSSFHVMGLFTRLFTQSSLYSWAKFEFGELRKRYQCHSL